MTQLETIVLCSWIPAGMVALAVYFGLRRVHIEQKTILRMSEVGSVAAEYVDTLQPTGMVIDGDKNTIVDARIAIPDVEVGSDEGEKLPDTP